MPQITLHLHLTVVNVALLYVPTNHSINGAATGIWPLSILLSENPANFETRAALYVSPLGAYRVYLCRLSPFFLNKSIPEKNTTLEGLRDIQPEASLLPLISACVILVLDF